MFAIPRPDVKELLRMAVKPTARERLQQLHSIVLERNRHEEINRKRIADLRNADMSRMASIPGSPEHFDSHPELYDEETGEYLGK